MVHKDSDRPTTGDDSPRDGEQPFGGQAVPADAADASAGSSDSFDPSSRAGEAAGGSTDDGFTADGPTAEEPTAYERTADEREGVPGSGAHAVTADGPQPETGLLAAPSAADSSHQPVHSAEDGHHGSTPQAPDSVGRTAAGGPAGGLPAGAAAAGASDRRSSDGVVASRESAAPAREPATDTGALSVRPSDEDVARRAAVRDNAFSAKPAPARFLQVVVALFFPVIVVAAAVRAVATSSFLWFEYHRPGFPADQFGFSLDDRMTYGSYALDYVLNFAPPRYLGGLVTPEGEPLFLDSEVGHMADVKGVLGLSFFIALVLFVLAVLSCIYLARRYKGGIRRALFAGAVLTLVGMVALTVLAVIGWETFFTQVHALFFADGTWTFRVDDTLIRLFPEQFWTDSAITIAVLVLGATILTLIATWPTKARRERSMLAQEAAEVRYRRALEAS
ncbi:TIGR01906 family membrane protein [Arthrobacter agilis]|uniref:TIGR01906 family membrane protein n=1 Tax=Arthrobacter agilis TaxID=37921 RepID=UPI0023658FDA|nr:TIGR01906 family membrane protein [Arthrobacter agilis]WDF34241.1 TIGR01906 family membrane protein [Arthrobacter agilis]